MPFDFVSKNPPKPLPGSDQHVKVDWDKGTVRIPGKPDLPLIGVDPKRLKSREEEIADFNARVAERMSKKYKCARCKRTFSGKLVRPRLKRELEAADVAADSDRVNELDIDRLRCPNPKCDGDVVEVR
jgi:hypothetical protein